MLCRVENITMPIDMKYKDSKWIPSTNNENMQHSNVDEMQKFLFNNKAPGYKQQVFVGKITLKDKRSVVESKVQTDAYFYSYLRIRFMQQHISHFRKFFNKFNFNDYFVIGLHLRFGSSHNRDFKEKHCQVENQEVCCCNIILLIHKIIQDKRFVQDKPFMLFLATYNQDAVNLLNQTIYNESILITLATKYQPNQLKFDSFIFFDENNNKFEDYDICMGN